MAMESLKRRPLQDWASLICGALLFLAPWVVGFVSDPASTRTAWITGLVTAVLAIAALVRFAEWEEWVTAVLGLWMIVAPWIVGFAAFRHASATFLILGIIVLVASASELWQVRHPAALAK